jgi:hypothetical protein
MPHPAAISMLGCKSSLMRQPSPSIIKHMLVPEWRLSSRPALRWLSAPHLPVSPPPRAALLQGVAAMGGVCFFNLAVDTPNGDMALLEKVGTW